jgi:diaminopimelate epimerase
MTLPRRFVKMAGGGNDFLVFEADGRRLSEEERRQVSLLCRRGLSVGADGALFLSGAGGGRVRLDYFNADGGLASFCANGTRCAARYAVLRKLVSGSDAVLETGWSVITAHVEEGSVTLALPDMPAPGQPILLSPEEPDRYAAEGLPPIGVVAHVGVPHLVVFVKENLESLPLDRLGPPLRHHPLLGLGANVNFVQVLDSSNLSVRTFERGVERETLSCGSGVVASAIVAVQRGHVEPPVACMTRSGVQLDVGFQDAGDTITGVTLTGDAREIFTAELNEEAWA